MLRRDSYSDLEENTAIAVVLSEVTAEVNDSPTGTADDFGLSPLFTFGRR